MSRFFKLIKAKNVTIEEPEVIKYYEGDSTTPKYANLTKEAVKFIFDISLKIPSTVNTKLYDISPEIWKDVVNLRISQNPDFKLDEFTYVMHNDFVFSLTTLDLKDSIDTFEQLYDNYNGYNEINIHNTLQLLWRKENPDSDVDYIPILLFDISFNDGKYKVYPGVLRNDRYIITSTPVIDENTFEMFITKNYEYEMSMSDKLAESVSNSYNETKGRSIKLSAREVIEFLKKAKIKINLDEDGLVESFDNIITGVDELLEFFETFKMPYKSLAKLPLLRKSVKSDGLVLDDFLYILSGDLFTYNNNIKAELIASLLRIYYTEESDILIMKELVENAEV